MFLLMTSLTRESKLTCQSKQVRVVLDLFLPGDPSQTPAAFFFFLNPKPNEVIRKSKLLKEKRNTQ